MASSSNQSFLRNGIVLRQVVLFVIFAAVLAGGIFEFAYSRPAFHAAWEKIEEIDSSAVSSEYTATQIEEMIGKQPLEIDSSQDRVEVRVYRWPSGLPFRSHDIRIVYTKLTGVLAENNPELAHERYYYSASGGTPLTSDNFPAERPTMVYNFNKPSRAGGPPPAASGGDSKTPPQIVVGDNEDGGKKDKADGKEQPEKDDKKAGEQKENQKSDPDSAGEDNKTPPESVENPKEPGEEKEAGEKADETTPDGGEQPVENPDSGGKGDGNQEVPKGGEGTGGEGSGG